MQPSIPMLSGNNDGMTAIAGMVHESAFVRLRVGGSQMNIESGELNFCANHMPSCAAVSGSSCEESLIASTASPILYVFGG